MQAPNSEQIINQLKTLAEGLLVWDGVGDIENPASYVASKSLAFNHIPLAFVPGENPDVLRSPLDLIESSDGTTEERINAFCFDEKRLSQTPMVHDNLRGITVPLGERLIAYTFRNWFFYQFSGASKIVVGRVVEAWRKKLISLPKLGFSAPESNFIDGHSEIQVLDEDIQPFDEVQTHLIDMELVVRVTEPQ